MTRDQATQLLENIRIPVGSDILEPLVKYPDRWVEAFVALGMLKLDEPKSAEEARAIKVFEYAALDGCKPEELVNRLGIAGLRIVEK